MAVTGAGMESALKMLESTALQAGNQIAARQRAQDTAGISGAQEPDFASALKSSIDRIDGMDKSAKLKGQAFARGDKDVALNDVMVDVQKGKLALQMGVEVRNKLVGAYKEVMNMQV